MKLFRKQDLWTWFPQKWDFINNFIFYGGLSFEREIDLPLWNNCHLTEEGESRWTVFFFVWRLQKIKRLMKLILCTSIKWLTTASEWRTKVEWNINKCLLRCLTRAENGELSRIGINSWLYRTWQSQLRQELLMKIKLLLYTTTYYPAKRLQTYS